jgi:hypothetical protein
LPLGPQHFEPTTACALLVKVETPGAAYRSLAVEADDAVCMRAPLARRRGCPGDTSEIIAPQSCDRPSPLASVGGDRLQRDAQIAALRVTERRLQCAICTSALGMANPSLAAARLRHDERVDRPVRR